MALVKWAMVSPKFAPVTVLTPKLIDINETSLEKAQANITKSLEKLESKGRLGAGQSKDSILAKLSFFSSLDQVSDRDLVIEAIVENEKIKLDLFCELDKLTDATCILASNTSSIPITRIASATNRPEKVIGMHFMNPVPIMKLVEVITGMATSDETKDKSAHWRKVWVKRSVPLKTTLALS